MNNLDTVSDEELTEYVEQLLGELLALMGQFSQRSRQAEGYLLVLLSLATKAAVLVKLGMQALDHGGSDRLCGYLEAIDRVLAEWSTGG